MEKQRTIEKEVTINGIGLHTACRVNVTFKPAAVDTGINFIRRDLAKSSAVKAVIENSIAHSRSPRRTSIGKDNVEIFTIEHLMSALLGMGIDNLIIELDNNELPGLDGSSMNYVEAINRAGIKEQEKDRQYYIVREPIIVEEDGASIIVVPSKEFKVSYTLKYDHPFIKTDFMEIDIHAESFKNQIAAARTFCLEEEAKQLQEHGLGLGASYDNALVVGKNGVIKNKLRFENEFVRHKILDLLGDIYLIGQFIKGHCIAIKSGHSLNLQLAKKIQQQKTRNLLGGIGIDYRPAEGEVLDAYAIMKILPHRDPFLFVDRIISLERGKHAVGLKNVTINDYFFKGHFPGRPVMPGVLMIEAMAQVGGVMMLSPEENRGKLAFFMSINNVKFRKTVVPGDQLIFDVVAGKIKSRTGQVHGKAFVDGRIVAEADLMFALAKL